MTALLQLFLHLQRQDETGPDWATLHSRLCSAQSPSEKNRRTWYQVRYQRASTSRVTPELFALAANRYIAVSSLFILKLLDLPFEQSTFLMLQHSHRREVER